MHNLFLESWHSSFRVMLVASYGLILSVIFLYMHLLSAPALFFVGVALLFSSIFIFSEKEQFLFIAFLIPNLFMYKYIEGPFAILGYFFIVLSLKYIFQHFYTIELNLFLALHFGICCLTCLYWSNFAILLSAIRFSLVFFLFYSLAKSTKEDEISLILDFFVFGAVVAIALGIIYRTNAGTLLNGFFAGIKCERNYFTAALSPVFSIILIQLMKKKNSLIKEVFYFISITMYFLCLILAASRTAAIALVFPCVIILSYFFMLKDDLLKIRNFLLIMFILLVGSLFLISQYGGSIDSFIERFSSNDMKTGNNRFVLWQYYFEQTISELTTFFIGHGVVFGQSREAEHNLVVECFNKTGLLGLLTLLGTFFYSVTKSIQSVQKLQVSAFMPLCAVVFCYMGISALHADQFSFLFILSLLVVRYCGNAGNT